jgi:hypothetical protein
MEDIKPTISAAQIPERKGIQLSLIIQALVFTGILYFSVGQAPQENTNPISLSIESESEASLPISVENSVLQSASRQLQLPVSELRIVEAQSQTWLDECLGLAESEASCSEGLIPGWQIAVASRRRRWLFRTNASGSTVKLERGLGVNLKASNRR